MTATAARETGIAKMKALAARQSTEVLCEALLVLAGEPVTAEMRLTHAVMLDVLCERHPEASAVAEALAESECDTTAYDAAVIGAALTAIGA